MKELKLAKLPDRTPVKITISVSPTLKADLDSYAEAYRRTYGDKEAEPVNELIPYILQSFLESDRGFAKARKNGTGETSLHTESRPAPRSARSASAATT